MKYLFHRLLKLIPTFFGVTVITFFLLYISPTDPAKMHYQNLGVSYTQDMLEEYRREKGLDQPFLIQYKNWLLRAFEGDLGESYDSGEPVGHEIKKAIPYTVSLAFNALILSLIIAIPAGFFIACHKDSPLSKILLAFSFLGNSLPNFILGLILIYIFALGLNWFPVLATNSARGIVLPSLTLALPMASKFVRQVSTITEEELNKDYIKGLKARGIPMRMILMRSVLKNISVNLVTLIGVSMGSLLGGTAIVESLFNWPGLGKVVVDSVLVRDYPMVLGGVLWMALAVTVINILTDLSYLILDPRIRLGGEEQNA